MNILVVVRFHDVFEPLLESFTLTVHISISKYLLAQFLAEPRGKIWSYQDDRFHDTRG